jgi:MFS superfamily sulfate permease-like transporter
MDLAWLVVTGLSGMIVGLVFGVLLSSALVKGHYTHILTNNQQRAARPQVAHPQPREYDPRYDDGYYY